MDFTKYNINFNDNKYLRDMTRDKLHELKTILQNFIDDTNYVEDSKLRLEVHGRKDTIEYQSICRISDFVFNYYKKLVFDDFANVFTPWDVRSWSTAENFITLDKKFFVRMMHSFWYCLPIVKYSPDIITVKTPDEIAMEGDDVKSYNNLYTCMLGFIVDLAEYILKLKEEK